MPDIFISYSRKDSAHALELAERLRSSGMEVWIDQRGIEAATSWSSEIVGAIEECQAFLLLLSESSMLSDNVVKELSIASESKRPILPVEISPTELPRSFKYQLTGIQRAQLSDFEGIVRSLIKLGIVAGEAGEPGRYSSGAVPAPLKDSRKSLMILPFEDLSPTQDNGWFADGIVSEMLGALGNVKALRLIDWNTSKEFKTRKVATAILAKELEVRYFLEGQVRKAGENIKVSVSLLDFETGDHLWQDSMKGTMNDIFDIQEKVAEKVVEGLKVHLASDEKKKLAERGTENAEAYELYLKAGEYFNRQTREGFQLALQQFSLAIEIDPNYANALQFKAISLAQLYRSYERDMSFLTDAEQLAKRALKIKHDLWHAYAALSNAYRLQGRLPEAEDAAKEYVKREPQNFHSHFGLGSFYLETNQPALAIAPFEKAIELKPDYIVAYYGLVLASDQSHDSMRIRKWSHAALPLHERHLRLVPDDESTRVNYANLLLYVGESKRAIEALTPLLEKQDMDSFSLYNIACLYARLNDTPHTLEVLGRSLAAGFRNIELISTDPDLDSLREMDEFQELMKELEAK